MPRGSRVQVSDYERRRWLEDLEKGRGITEISRAADRDIRVVKRHIEIAREERELAQARHDFIRSRLELHQDDLLKEAHRIREVLDSRRVQTLQPKTAREQKLHKAFHEHTRRFPVGEMLAEWESAVGDYIDSRDGIRRELEAQEAKLVSTLTSNFPANVAPYDWTAEVVADYESNLLKGTTLTDAYTKLPAPDGPQCNILWGRTVLARDPFDETLYPTIEETHGKLRAQADKSFRALHPLGEKVKALASRIVDDLDVFALKRLVSGRCRYCPA